MININDKIPNLSAKNQDDKDISLLNFIGKKLVIFFYPKANTTGCTAEACDLNNNIENFKRLNYAIIGISADSVKKQKAFHQKYNLQYDLLADESKEIINAFGVWGRKKFMGKEYDGILRTTFIFNEQGILENIITDVKTKNHTQQILK